LRRVPQVVPLLTLALGGCYDFHLTGPEDAAPLNPPATVSVTIEYRQPNGCLSAPSPNCEEPVVFYATWLRPGAEVRLTKQPGGLIWRGTAQGVPVNYPPRDDPYQVRIYDPYLVASCAVGFSADRIVLGSEALVRTIGGGCQDQFALVYIDSNGQGHNPF
jgi:hypothetical protein